MHITINPVSKSPGALHSPDGRSLFVGSFGADPEAGIVHVIDRTSRRPVAEVAVGGGPRGIAFTEDGRHPGCSNA
jgi:YVTN family beta-propeller protein